RAGILSAPEAPIQGLPGQPVEVSFRLYKVAEDGVPLASNAPFEEPLDGQRVQLTVERISGAEVSNTWGFDGTKRTVASVSRQGVVRETLTLAPSPGRYRVTARWREGAACESSVDVVTPAHIASRVLTAPSHPAWTDAVMGLVARGETTTRELTRLVRDLVVSTTKVELTDDWSGSEELGVDDLGLTRAAFDATLQTWVFVSDRDQRPIPGRTMRVTVTGRDERVRAAVTPEAPGQTVEVTTDDLGLARAHLSATGVADERYPSARFSGAVRLELTDPAASTYQPAPYPVTDAWSPQGAVQRAWVGPQDPAGATSERFRLDLSRSVVAGRTLHGTATLVAPLFRDDGGLGQVTIPGVALNGIVLDASGFVVAGEVVFDAGAKPDAGCSDLGGGGQLCIHRLSLPAGHDASVTGVVTLPLQTDKGRRMSTGKLRFTGSWTPG
ncbi:MAG: hypothetical protein QF464_19740, partial [Myxococcota bacterium]|nr:hypothetical protein [Myxococcota bacterium]